MRDRAKETCRRYRSHLRRIFLGYTVAAILLMIVLFIALILWVYRYAVRYENRSYNGQIVSAAAELYTAYEEGSLTLAADPAVLRAVKEGDTGGAEHLLRSFGDGQTVRCYYTLFDDRRSPVCSNLYPNNLARCMDSDDTVDLLDTLRRSPWKGANRISRAGYSNGQETVYQFGAAIREEGRIRGYLILELRRRALIDLFASRPVSEVVVVDRYQSIIYTTMATEGFFTDDHGTAKWNQDWTSPTEVIVNRKPYYATRTIGEAFGRPDIIIYTLTSGTILMQGIRYGFTFIAAVGVLLFTGMLMLANWAARKSLVPLDGLVESASHWSNGDMDYRIPPQPFAEYQSIRDSFNGMMDRVQSLLQKNKELNDSNYQMELRNMEALFNPHFVFNILETIKYMILIDTSTASRMVVSFARLLRYSLNYGQAMVPLSTDMEYIEDYLDLQKQRFGNRLSCRIDIDEELLSCAIPKLLLQPLVENAILHNAEYVAEMQVEITGRRSGSCLVLTVSDNGRGISDESLLELYRKMENRESIGLYYVDRTLRLRYGEPYRLQLQSREGQGTCAVVIIPLGEGT